MIKIKELIKQLQTLPPNTELVGYDLRMFDNKKGQAIHLFQQLDLGENLREEDEVRKIGF